MEHYYSIGYVREFADTVDSQITRLLVSVAEFVQRIRKAKLTKQEEVSQKNLDLNDLQTAALKFVDIHKMVRMAKSEAETDALTNPKRVAFKQSNISSIVSSLNQAYNIVMKIQPRAKLYEVSSVFDTKNRLSVTRRFNNLTKLFQGYTSDREDRALLREVRSGEVKADLVRDRLICMADRLDYLGEVEAGNILDRIIQKFAAIA